MIYLYRDLKFRSSQHVGSLLDNFYKDKTLVIDGKDLFNNNWNDIVTDSLKAIDHYKIKKIVIDISNDPMDLRYPLIVDTVEFFSTVLPVEVLHSHYAEQHHSNDIFKYFPSCLFAYSSKRYPWDNGYKFKLTTQENWNSDYNKTNELMCLNRISRWPRILLFNDLYNRNLLDKIFYSFIYQTDCSPEDIEFKYLETNELLMFKKNQHLLPWILPNELHSQNQETADPSVNQSIYKKCAVNLVTETMCEAPWSWITEKSCKPFVAYQIPIIIGTPGIATYLDSIGLDMFSDLIPWKSWDNESDVRIKLKMIVDFVESWLLSGDILSHYQSVLPRVQRNKQYFHSEEFRNLIMYQMIKL